jgi:isoquinoline 1-oxidoreductase beta subunit
MSEQLSRRRFLGYLVAAPTLTVAVSWTADLIHPEQAKAAVPSPPQPEETSRSARSRSPWRTPGRNS